MIFFSRMHDKLDLNSKLANATNFKNGAKCQIRENLRSHPGESMENVKLKKNKFGRFPRDVVDGFLN